MAIFSTQQRKHNILKMLCFRFCFFRFELSSSNGEQLISFKVEPKQLLKLDIPFLSEHQV